MNRKAQRKRFSIERLITFILFVVIMGWAITTIVTIRSEKNHLIENGISVVGTPTGEYWEGKRGGRYSIRTTYEIRYEFTVDGRRYIANGERDYDTPERVQEVIDQMIEDGDTVEIRYDEDNPSENIVIIETEPAR